MIRPAWVLLALLAGCTAAHDETETDIRITSGWGGFIGPKHSEYLAYSQTGKRIVVDGHVVSADAFFAFAFGGCYTKNAVWSPHSAARLGLFPDRETTAHLAAILPAPLRRWFEESTAYNDTTEIPRVKYRELRRIWPEGECEYPVPG